MRRARVAVAAALTVLLAGLIVWIARNTEWAETTIPSPLRGEARTNPFYAAEHLARELGATVSADKAFVAPSSDGVLVVSRLRWGLSAGRQRAMQAWVEQGGRLVVDQTVLDDPSFRSWSGIEQMRPRTRPVRDNAAGSDEPTPPGCRPLEPWPKDQSTPPGPPFQLCDFGTVSYLETVAPTRWELRDRRGAQVVRVPAGRGSITAINAVPFMGTDPLEFANAAMFVASTQLRPGNDVHFLTEADYPSLLALVWLQGWPAVTLFLAFTGAWVWTSAVRFGPPAPPDHTSRRSLEEQIRGTGEFARRNGGSEALVLATRRALDDLARRRITGWMGMSPEERAQSLTGITGLPQDALLSALTEAPVRTVRSLDVLYTLETARRQLSAPHTRTSHG